MIWKTAVVPVELKFLYVSSFPAMHHAANYHISSLHLKQIPNFGDTNLHFPVQMHRDETLLILQ